MKAGGSGTQGREPVPKSQKKKKEVEDERCLQAMEILERRDAENGKAVQATQYQNYFSLSGAEDTLHRPRDHNP